MKKNIFKLTALLLAAFSFSGCLKDKDYDNNEYQSLRDSDQKVVSIALRTDVNSNVTTYAFDASTTSTTINLVPVTLAGGKVADQDVHVQLDTSVALIDAYNLANGPTFTPAPTNKYSIISKTVTIPKGQSTGYMQVKLILADFIGDTYAIGVKILSVDGGYTIAGNGKNAGIAGIAIKNLYDGRYTGRAYTFMGSTNTTPPYLLTWDCDEEIDLATSGANSVQMNVQVVIKNGGFVNYGIYPKIIFDLATNKVTSVVGTGPISCQFPAPGGVPGYDSRYDPATKTIYVQYGVNGSATWVIRDTMTYCAPRP
jgi:hypothetical protein